MITKSWLMDVFAGTSNFRFYSNGFFDGIYQMSHFVYDKQEALPKLCRSFPGANPTTSLQATLI